ncbi:unnamed protein product [Rotaria sp. Silwood1]|nr:unnamed protein product [Rotaria sp. Silwood1]
MIHKQHYLTCNIVHSQFFFLSISITEYILQLRIIDLNEIIITSGGTESNNLAIRGIRKSNLNKLQHIITSQIEHTFVMNALSYSYDRNIS